MDSPVNTFNAHRSRLLGIAYRMLGSRAAAEDVLQEAYIRWHQSDTAEVRSAEAWLVTSVTRLCIDHLRAAKTVSDITHTHAPMAELERLRQHFDDKEIVELTYAVAQINAWNRLAIGLHVPVKRAALVPSKGPADARS